MRGLGAGVRACWLLDGHSLRSLPSLALHGLHEQVIRLPQSSPLSPLGECLGLGARASIRCKIPVRTRIQAGVSVMRGLGAGVRACWWWLQLLDGHSPRSLPSLALHGMSTSDPAASIQLPLPIGERVAVRGTGLNPAQDFSQNTL